MKTENVNRSCGGFAVTIEKYEPIRTAILASVPRGGPGLTFKELVARVAAQVSADLFPKAGSVSWYTKVVQLDLESRGQLVRVPGQTPQRLRRTGRAHHSQKQVLA
ncbi:MAG TPA: hypothetical protein VJZ71_06470 [Phycisphaerae bacterium]|nr:hypothetical protein [Phycisphaerae bacterium]